MARASVNQKRICHACHRPFDPTSPGATATMGPTCAKRGTAGADADGSQLSFIDGISENELVIPVTAPVKRSRLRREPVPPRLQELYMQAKMAFEEIYREYSGNGSILYGDAAQAREQELIPHDFEEHTLRDPLLEWLEPEQDVCMLIDNVERMIYLRRVFNGVASFLEIPFQSEGPILKHVETIKAFTFAIRSHREAGESVQPSLFSTLCIELDR